MLAAKPSMSFLQMKIKSYVKWGHKYECRIKSESINVKVQIHGPYLSCPSGSGVYLSNNGAMNSG